MIISHTAWNTVQWFRLNSLVTVQQRDVGLEQAKLLKPVLTVGPPFPSLPLPDQTKCIQFQRSRILNNVPARVQSRVQATVISHRIYFTHRRGRTKKISLFCFHWNWFIVGNYQNRILNSLNIFKTNVTDSIASNWIFMSIIEREIQYCIPEL